MMYIYLSSSCMHVTCSKDHLNLRGTIQEKWATILMAHFAKFSECVVDVRQSQHTETLVGHDTCMHVLKIS